MKKNQISISDVANDMRLSYSLVCKILNNDPNFRPSKSTRARVLLKAQEMGFDYSRLRRIHRRKHKRAPVNIPGEVIIRKKLDNEVFDSGTAVIKDISPTGTNISDFQLEGGSLPAAHFVCEFKVTEGILKNIVLIANPVRIKSKGSFMLGLEFEKLSREHARLIASIK